MFAIQFSIDIDKRLARVCADNVFGSNNLPLGQLYSEIIEGFSDWCHFVCWDEPLCLTESQHLKFTDLQN